MRKTGSGDGRARLVLGLCLVSLIVVVGVLLRSPEHANADAACGPTRVLEVTLDELFDDGGHSIEEGACLNTGSVSVNCRVLETASELETDSELDALAPTLYLMDGDEVLQRVECSGDEKTEQGWSICIQTTLSDGMHRLHVMAEAMDTSVDSHEFAFESDTEVPVISLLADAEYTNADVTCTLVVEDSSLASLRGFSNKAYDGGETHEELDLDSVSGAEQRLLFREPGDVSLEVVAKDKAGNVAHAECAFTLDKQAPAIDDVRISMAPGWEYQTAEDGGTEWFFDEAVRVDLEAHDMRDNSSPGELVDVVFDGVTGGGYQSTVDNGTGCLTVFMQDGDVIDSGMSFVVRDRAGNEARWTICEDGMCVGDGDALSYPTSIVVDIISPYLEVEGAEEGEFYAQGRSLSVALLEANLDTMWRISSLQPDVVQFVVEVWRDGVPYRTFGIDDLDSGQDAQSGILDIALDEDGSYALCARCTDPAGHTFDVQLGAFEIDTTCPVIEVSYDNDEVVNGKYYKRHRIATCKVVERNFDPRLFELRSEGMPGGWSSDGDLHMLEVAFDREGTFRLEISGSDLAGNAAPSFESGEFIIDCTPPEVDVTGVDDRAAYSGDVRPAVELRDENHDLQADSVRLSGGMHAEQVLPLTQHDAHVSSCLMDGFPFLQENDDIYTLRASSMDLAGNETHKEVIFSVNRFGSTYRIAPESQDYLAGFENSGYRSYTQKVVIEEVNVDELTQHSVVVLRDGIVNPLVEQVLPESDIAEHIGVMGGMDGSLYSFAGGEGQGAWHSYAYTVTPAVFAQEGTYRVILHSVDAAGNISENTLGSKGSDIGFTMDRSKPVVRVDGVLGGARYAGSDRDISITAFDNMRLGSVDVRLDGEQVDWEPVDDEMVLTLRSDDGRAHDLCVVAYDAAGNVSDKAEVSGFAICGDDPSKGGMKWPLLVASVVLAVALGVTAFIRAGISR